eukprot:CAMPEP_0172493496 /NCGR_PEP_ID=MMETSP1066-20121228/24955_1 /TAXON_ID=671091 /ORGANISM="Coscinodiscus wailesii, Strain CCMP2513" /LENGTH=73 /DNA_ID=CAMNT_0013263697 /DNA_START=310 /DNA_END=531 /DNA_ORIENTATION=+
MKPLNSREEPLNSSQIRRGAFNNSGSRDGGIDPDWDFKTGRRKRKEGDTDHDAEDDRHVVDLWDPKRTGSYGR